MNKRFRAWDGETYWYSNEHFMFINDLKVLNLQVTPIEAKNIDQFIGKTDASGVMIYENDLITMVMPKGTKVFQVIWSAADCGFRKVPHGMPFPETNIDEAFYEVIGTIHSQK